VRVVRVEAPEPDAAMGTQADEAAARLPAPAQERAVVARGAAGKPPSLRHGDVSGDVAAARKLVGVLASPPLEGPDIERAPSGLSARASGRIENPERVVARHQPGFRRCFEAAGAAGKVELAVEVGPSGRVSDTTGRAAETVPPAVVHCVERRALGMRFAPPEGGPAAVPVTVVYLRQ
jgi:outer membrane biosynthesis protein TonB